MSAQSLSSCLSGLSSAAEDPAGLSRALRDLRSRHVSRAGGAGLFRRKGGLELLVALLTDPSRAAALGTSRRNLELTLSLLANSCTEAGSRVRVRELGGITALICILRSVCIDSIWNRVSRALGNLAQDPRNSLIIHESGAIPSLVQILQSSQDVGCLQSCLRALRILGDSLHHRLSICQQGGLVPCVHMLTYPDPEVVCAAVRAVCELSRGCSLDCAEQLCPAVPTLMALASEDQVKSTVRQAATGTLCNLCSQGALRPMLGNAGVIKLLITEVMAVQDSLSRCLPTVRALCFCCREAVNRIRVRELGGLELLLDLLRSPQYRSVHHRITVAFLHYCHDTNALSVLGLGGLAPLLAERLEEMVWAAEERPCDQNMREAPDEEEGKESASYDFPPEPKNKKEQEGSSEASLRSWLLMEGYINSLEDFPPEWILDRETREESTGPMSSPYGKGNQVSKLLEKKNPMSGHLCFSPPSTQSCPIQAIFASPPALVPRSPPPSEVFEPEFPVLVLLSRFSHLSDLSSCLVSYPILNGLLTYVTCHPNPSNRAARLLQRLTCDPLCLEAFIRTGNICTLRARLLLHECPDGEAKEKIRHPERARELGHLLLRNLCIQAESPFGVGLVNHMLASGSVSDRQQCALCLPFIYRKDSPQCRNLLDGAIRLILEELMLSMDPEYFFHASECLSSIRTPETLQCPSSCIRTPETLQCPSSCIRTPETLQCPSSIRTPETLQCPSFSIRNPETLQCPSSSIQTPETSPAPPKSCSPTLSTCSYLELLPQGQGGDIVFVLDGGERLVARRDLVSKGCEVFHAMLQGGYAESQQHYVHVREVPHCAFLPLLHYLHGCSQDSLCPTLQGLQQIEPDQELLQSPLAFTLVAAGRFLLPGLQSVLEDAVQDSLLTLDNLPSVYNFAEVHESARLRRDCCVYLLRKLHPPRSRSRTLLRLCELAQDKRQLSQHLEDVLHGRA